MILLRGLVRLVAFLLLLALAAAGLVILAAAVDPGAVVSHLQLRELRGTIGTWLDALAADGSRARFSALGGALAMLLGLLLLAGLLVPRRERMVLLEDTDAGELHARRRPLAQLAEALTEQVRGVSGTRTKVRVNRHGGGRLTVRADLPRTAEAGSVDAAITTRLAALTGPFELTARVETRTGPRGKRVE